MTLIILDHAFMTILFRMQPEDQSSVGIAVGQLVAVRTEREEDAPWIARVTAVDPGKDAIDVIWMEGKYSGQWKVAKMRRGRALVEWRDSVEKACIILYGFELTGASRLKEDTIRELKESYSQYFK